MGQLNVHPVDGNVCLDLFSITHGSMEMPSTSDCWMHTGFCSIGPRFIYFAIQFNAFIFICIIDWKHFQSHLFRSINEYIHLFGVIVSLQCLCNRNRLFTVYYIKTNCASRWDLFSCTSYIICGLWFRVSFISTIYQYTSFLSLSDWFPPVSHTSRHLVANEAILIKLETDKQKQKRKDLSFLRVDCYLHRQYEHGRFNVSVRSSIYLRYTWRRYH